MDFDRIVTLSLTRASATITCTMINDGNDQFDLLDSVDEFGSDVDLTPDELSELIDRARAGEDETGR